MIIQSAWQLSFGFFGAKPVVVEPVATQVSSDDPCPALRNSGRLRRPERSRYVAERSGLQADLCGRGIDDDELASQPTLSRFENSIGHRGFFQLQDMLLNQFMASFDKPPTLRDTPALSRFWRNRPYRLTGSRCYPSPAA
jgi:hypothetical protein